MILILTIIFCIGIAKGLSPQDLQNEINAAIANGKPSYTVPSGTYNFSSTSLEVFNATDFSLIANDVKFVFSAGAGFKAVECTNVKLIDYTIDYDPPAFTQGTVVSFQNTAKTNFSVDVDIDGSYWPLPDESSEYKVRVVKVIWWEKDSGRLLPGQGGINNWLGFERVSGAPSGFVRFRAYLPHPPQGNPKPGDMATFSPRIGVTHLLQNSSRVEVNSVQIWGSSNMAFVEQCGDGGHLYDNVRLIRPPVTSDRPLHLLASNADAFHSNSPVYGPTIKNSEFSFAGDDLMNLHNELGLLWKIYSPTEMLLIDKSGIGVGSLLYANLPQVFSFYELNTNTYISNATVTTITQITNSTIVQEAAQVPDIINKPPYNAHMLPFYTPLVINVTFSHPVDPKVVPYSIVENYGKRNLNSLVENSYFHDGFDTAGKIKSIGTKVINNTFVNVNGIHVALDQPWLEGDAGLADISIINNTFINCSAEANATITSHLVTNFVVANNTIIPGTPPGTNS